MDYIGSDFNSTGSVIPKSELTAARLKRGECVTCGRKCYKKKLFKMIPIDDQEGKILNGRCLHCNPLHNNNKNTKNNSSSHSYNSNSGRKLQRSKSHHPDVMDLKHHPTSRDVSHKQQRRNSLSGPLPRSLSGAPPQTTQPTNSNYPTDSASKTDMNHNSTRSVRSTGNVPVPSPPWDNSTTTCSKSIHTEPFHNDGKSPARGHSFHSTASSSIGSLESVASSTTSTATTTRQSQHRCRPPSPQTSLGSSSSVGSTSNSNSNSNPSPQQMEGTSREELKRAALLLMAAAQEHGLAEAGGALAASLQDIVNMGVTIATSETPPHATSTILTADDDEKRKDHLGVIGGYNEDEYTYAHAQTGENRGFLDRGGAFPMRYGRLIYTGSTRTLSSMSSIDEGDRQNPIIHVQSPFQQALRAVGKSSRTLGSLSTIDGTNEEEMNFLNAEDTTSKNELPMGSVPTVSSHESVKAGETVESSALLEERILTQKMVPDKRQEETKVYDVEIDTILQGLRDSIHSSSLARSVEGMESLLESLAMFCDDLPSRTDLYIERGLVGVLVAVMRHYAESSEIQVKACEVLAKLVACDSGHQSPPSTRLKQSQTIMERAGEVILFSSMILHEDNPAVQEAALNSIRYLCKDCTENQTSFWKLDAIEPILRAMEHHPYKPRLQETGATVVSMLATNPKNENAKSTIGRNGGVPLVIRAISVHLEDLQVVESCSHALYTLILECPHNTAIVFKSPGVTSAILDGMRSHSQSVAVQEMFCAILVNLTMQADNVDLLLDNGGQMKKETTQEEDSSNLEGKPNEILERVIQIVLETIQTHTNATTVQEFGFAVLANLIDSDETKMFIVDMGALDAIVLAMVLHEDDLGVQKRTCSLLLLLAVQENLQPILAANPIELVKKAARKFPEECLESANQLIRQLGLLDF